MGIIDISLLLNYFGFGPQQVVQAPIPRKQPAKPPEKPAISPKQPQAQEKVSTPPPAPSEPTPPAVSKEEKLVELETPTAIAQAAPGEERIEKKAPSVSTTDQPKPPEVSAKQEPQPLPLQTQPSAKPSATEVSPSPPRTPEYPYSVYLGSLKAHEAVKKAISDYQEKGLSPYWTKVDLGDKGVWFRVFAGYFRTKDETEKYIRDRNIQGATPGITKYANWIGSYGSDKEVEDQKRALLSAGFYPYVIKAPDGKSLLYSGAFDRKEYAEKERSALASKGIKSEVVER
jgi:cell division septation protein DedD